MPNLSNFLGAGSIVTGFLFAGVIILISDFISKKFTKGRLHPSAIAIFFGLIFAYVGGVVTGGEKGLADVAAFGGLGILGGSALRDFTIIASSYGASIQEVKKCGWACPISLVVGVTSAFCIGAIVAVSFGYTDAVSITTIAAGAVTFVVGPITGTALGAASEVLALSVTVGLVKTVCIMIFTPLIAKKIGLTSPKMAMIFGGLVGSTSGVSAGLAATDASLVPYGTMVATFYSGTGCLLCPSLLYAIVNLFF
jgi:malonate transporter MadM subunit